MVTGKLAKSLPDKPGEFAGHGHKGFVTMDPAGQQAHEAAVQAVLRLPTGFEDGGGLAFLSAGQFLANLRGHGVVLAAFNQEPAGVGVPAFGAEPPGGERDRLSGRQGEARTCGSR